MCVSKWWNYYIEIFTFFDVPKIVTIYMSEYLQNGTQLPNAHTQCNGAEVKISSQWMLTTATETATTNQWKNFEPSIQMLSIELNLFKKLQPPSYIYSVFLFFSLTLSIVIIYLNWMRTISLIRSSDFQFSILEKFSFFCHINCRRVKWIRFQPKHVGHCLLLLTNMMFLLHWIYEQLPTSPLISVAHIIRENNWLTHL